MLCLQVSDVLLTPAKLWVLLLLKELLLSGILLVHGRLAAVLCLRLIHVVDWLSYLRTVRRCKSRRMSIVGQAAQFRLVHVLLLSVQLEPRVAIRAAKLRLVLLLEIVLLCGRDAAIARRHIASHSLVVLEELALGRVFVGHALVLRVHGLLSLEELVLGALSQPVVVDVLAEESLFSVLIFNG